MLGLRVPGHGTAPAALADSSWKDFVAATRLGANHLHAVLGPDRPFYIAGYSNGAALAVEYALESMEDDALPQPDGLLLLSPAIGLSEARRLRERAGADRPAALLRQGGMDLDPSGVRPLQVQLLPRQRGRPDLSPHPHDRQAHPAPRRARGRRGLPSRPSPSSPWSTPPFHPPPSFNELLEQLEPNGHELVVFDVNRRAAAEDFLISDPTLVERHLLTNPELPFAVTMVTNESPESLSVVALRKPARSNEVTREPLGLSWPPNVFSLSHVAIPFAPDDPLYGVDAAESEVPLLSLGLFEPRGERGVLVVSAGFFARLRHNPFFDYMAGRIVETYAPAPSASP